MPTPNLYDRIVGQRSSLETLMARLPGYRGYKDMTDRRASDRLIRDHVVQKLRGEMDHLVQVEKKLLASGDLSKAALTREGKMKFQTFIDKIATSAPGYSGFYDAKKVGPDELTKVYAFDAALLDYVDKFKGVIDALSGAIDAKQGIEKAAADLETLANEALSAYSLRDDIFTGLSQN
ncbi:MAG TPA: hypothetical protein VMT34_16200 [Aggregatilineales bacterium]|nr:hypothetical protein [Aggregatilineales bacterium]